MSCLGEVRISLVDPDGQQMVSWSVIVAVHL